MKRDHCTEVRFASTISGGVTTMAAINPPERKLAKRTSVQWSTLHFRGWQPKNFKVILSFSNLKRNSTSMSSNSEAWLQILNRKSNYVMS